MRLRPAHSLPPGRLPAAQVRNLVPPVLLALGAFASVALATASAAPAAVLGLGLLASALGAGWAWSHLQRAARRAGRPPDETWRAQALAASASHTAIVVTDLQRRITWANPAFERLTGFSIEQVIGCSPGALLQCPQTDPVAVQAIRDALDAAQPFEGEILNRARDGRLYWVELRIQPLREEGRLTGFLSLESDVTQRHRAEEALRANQAFLDSTGRVGGVGGWTLDLTDGTLAATDQALRILGRGLGSVLDRAAFMSHCADSARPLLHRVLEAPPEPGSTHDLELPFLRADGQPIWVRLVAEGEYSDRGVLRLIGALQDITARRAIEAESTRNAALLRGAIDVIDEAFVLYDADDRLVLCNERYLKTYETSRDLIVPGARFEDILRGGVARGQYATAIGQEEEWITRRLAAHRAADHSHVQRLDNGQVLRVVERRMVDGHLVGFRVDITDLVHATDEAERANRAKSDFIATISHELRTPLQAINGFSDLGRSFARDKPPFDAMFEDIHAAGQRMLTLVNGLLDISRMDGGTTLQQQTQPLRPLVQAVIHELRQLAASRRIELRLQPATDDGPRAAVDGFRWQQVVRNVLANAMRFAPEGSSVTLAFGPWVDGGSELRVTDRGPGIPPDELQSVFEPFVQSSRTRDGSGGSGLGLAICRRIMRAHGGEIVASLPDEGGTCIHIRQPPPARSGPGGPASSNAAPVDEVNACPTPS